MQPAGFEDTTTIDGPAGDPRVVRTRAAVLGACTDLLLEGGLGAATIEAVGARAGVSKVTIYRYWPNRTALAIDALLEHMGRETPLVDEGSAIDALADRVRGVCAAFTGPAGTVYAQLVGQTTIDAGAAELLASRYDDRRRGELRAVWERGVERGELRVDIDVELALDLLFGPITFRLLRDAATLDATVAEGIIATVMPGLRA